MESLHQQLQCIPRKKDENFESSTPDKQEGKSNAFPFRHIFSIEFRTEFDQREAAGGEF